jgi:hypothetical protein
MPKRISSLIQWFLFIFVTRNTQQRQHHWVDAKIIISTRSSGSVVGSSTATRQSLLCRALQRRCRNVQSFMTNRCPSKRVTQPSKIPSLSFWLPSQSVSSNVQSSSTMVTTISRGGGGGASSSTIKATKTMTGRQMEAFKYVSDFVLLCLLDDSSVSNAI